MPFIGNAIAIGRRRAGVNWSAYWKTQGLSLPTNGITLIAGKNVTIYGNTLIFVPNINNLTYEYTCDIGTQSGNDLAIVTDAGDIGEHDCRIVIKSSGTTVVDKTIKLTVTAAAEQNIKVLMVGDSLLATGCGYYATAIDGCFTGTKAYIGTQGTTTLHEGYSGAAWANFLASDIIKLCKAGVLNVTAFFADNSFDTPDYVHIRLGVNAIFWNSDGTVHVNNTITDNLNDAKTLIDAFLAYDANLKVIVGLPTICNVSEAKWNQVYDESVYSMDLYNRLMHEFWTAEIAAFANGAYDRRVDMDYAAIFMSRSNYVDAVHPTATGYGQLGVAMGMAINSKAAMMTLVPTGTGAGVTTIKMTTSADQTITVDGAARFYTNVGATEGESTSWVITAGAERTIYLKCPSGTANFRIPDATLITKWGSSSGTNGWASSTDATRIGGTFSKFTNLTELRVTGYTDFTGALPSGLQYLYMSLNAKWVYTGALPAGLTFLWVQGNAVTWTYDGSLPDTLAYINVYSTTMNWTGLDVGDTGNIGVFELGNYRVAKMSSADMVTLLTQLTNRTGTLPATIAINDYADYASPPSEVTDAVDALKLAKSVTTVILGA